MGRGFVIGVDAGGSYTRAVCAGLDGRVLGSGLAAGGSPTHNANARDHVQSALGEALAGAGAKAGVKAGEAVGLAAGMAGLDRDQDRVWAEAFVEVDGLTCPRHVVNDAVVAHRGAFAGGPGVMVVAGTGSIILAVTEAGEQVRNDRYHHYAGGARHLAFDALARVLVDEDTAADAGFVREVLRFWNVSDKHGLRQVVREQESADYNDIKHAYGAMGVVVTGAAEHSPLASAACWNLVRKTCVGVRLLAGHVDADVVPVALHGGLALSPAFAGRMATELDNPWRKRFEIRDAVLSPVTGAALLALQRAGVPVDDVTIKHLAAFDQSMS